MTSSVRWLGILSVAFAAMIVTAPTASAATITQSAPTSNASPDVAGTPFNDQLVTTGQSGTETFSPPVTLPTGVTVSSTGQISSDGTTPVGSYALDGSDSDTSTDSGSWTYTLTVSPENGTISQSAPTTNGSPDVAGSAFSDQLVTSGQKGTETFSPPGTLPTGVTVSASGQIHSNGTTPEGSYSLSGTDADTFGNSGSWSYTLAVSAEGGTITQVNPLSNAAPVYVGGSFSDQLSTTGQNGVESFSESGTPPTGVAVSATGQITTNGTTPAAGYTLSGQDVDSFGNTGSWSYTLTISAVPSGGGGGSSPGGSIKQTSATSGVTTTGASSTFAGGAITVQGATGTVKFVTTSPNSGLSVDSSGTISSTGTLAAGYYTVSGTDSDQSGDTGTWTFTLTVNGITATVSFNSDSGTGLMAGETQSEPTALTKNTFKRAGYTFAGWNTVVNGSGTSYSNGAIFPFTSSLTLYAQWSALPTYVVTFNANAGIGVMAPEGGNVATSLSANAFTRVGFVFAGWNTTPNGLGKNYANRAQYAFTSSVTLYAQWGNGAKHAVTFKPNGGTGVMALETKSVPSGLTINAFTRTKHHFAGWSTAPNGSGSRYTNGATYDFTASATLYAQWIAVKVVVPLPAVHAVVSLSPFSAGSASLSSSLVAQINALAREVKSKRDTKIALVGYSGKLTAANQLNETAWAASLKISGERAAAVEAYLKRQLVALGVKNYTISAVGTGTANPPGSLESQLSQAKNRCVIATLT